MSKFSQELCKLQSSNVAYIWRLRDCIAGLRLQLIAIIFQFLIIFQSKLFCMLALKVCVSIFLGTTEARILKLGIHMDKEQLYSRIGNRAHYSFFSLFIYFSVISVWICVTVFSGIMQTTIFKFDTQLKNE